MSELETELALLREENAQLKVERHRPTDAGHVIERMRSLRSDGQAEASKAGAEPPAENAQMIAECLVVRDGLIEACQEAQRAMQGIRARLGALPGDIHSRVEQQSIPDRQPPRAEQAIADEGSPELAQSVA